jgi:alpha/beta hydrolase family protein
MFRRLFLIVSAALFTLPCHAEVVRIEVKSRADLLAGKSFGSAGAYEKLSGRIYFAVDPRNSANRIIADIDNAQKNAAGKVEFSSDFYIIKPKELKNGNGSVLYEVSNRGNKGMLGFFDFASASVDPQNASDFGDGFLLEQGFTLVWIGWQFDVPNREGALRSYLPIAREADGRTIQGLVRSDFEPVEKIAEASLADRGHMAYTVTDPKDPANILTVRDTPDGPRRTIARDQWEFTPDGRSVRMAQGFEPRKIYEVVYKSQDPPIAGLGLAAVRDAISHLKYGTAPELSVPAGVLKRAIGFGASQSGRFLRTFVYDGFNEDESHRRVFDGLMIERAASARGSFNIRFAQASRDGDPWANFLYPVNVFPFTDAAQLDPETGRRDGMLTHHMKEQFWPKIMYTNSSYEYWGRVASLFHTTIDGKEDVSMLTNVRAYVFASAQHGPAAFPPPRTIGQQLNNPLEYRWSMRKLLLSMNRWIADGTEPPPSALPRISDGTLITRDKLKFPSIPNIGVPAAPQTARRADYGADFLNKRVVSYEPPKLGSAFPALVPQTDADGNDMPGIRMPELLVPLATFTGWNLFNDRSGPTNVMSTTTGSFIPFARTRADRERNSDPRPSVEERYRSKEDYLERITKSANDLAARGYLIKEDVPRIVQQAGSRWDWIMENSH